jgi:hypothetical protein
MMVATARKSRKLRPSTVYVASEGSASSKSSRTGVVPACDDSPQAVIRVETIKAHLHDFYDDLNSNIESKLVEIWDSFYEKYHSPQYIMIRPSGNPIRSQGFIEMFCSEDVLLLSFSLISVDMVRIMAQGKGAVATYTVDQRFMFKGTLNEDRVVLTCVLEEIEGDIKIAFEQRTNGRPIPKKTRWDSL